MPRRLVFDIECDGLKLDAIRRVWCLVAADLDTGEEFTFGPHQIPQGVRLLQEAGTLFGHNVSEFDLEVLRHRFRFDFTGRVIDTLILSRMIFNHLSDEADQHGRHALAAWGSRLGFQKSDWKDFSRWQPAMLEYCRRDVEVTRRLIDRLREARPSSRSVNLEMDYAALLRRAERNGFSFDVQAAHKFRDALDRHLARIQRRLDVHFPPTVTVGTKPGWYQLRMRTGLLFQADPPLFATKHEAESWRRQQRLRPAEVELIAGPAEERRRHFNANSNAEVAKALVRLGWIPPRETKSGGMKVAEVDLVNSRLPAARLIAGFRAYTKLRSYVDSWITHERDGKLFCRFLSNQAATGRSSAQRPNLQQIPKGSDRKSGLRLAPSLSSKCRTLFKPQPGYVLVGCDLAGIELRLLGHRLAPYDGGEFARSVSGGGDIHAKTAEALGISREEAKRTTYAATYGSGAAGLAAILGVSHSEAKRIITTFTEGLPGFAAFKRQRLAEHARDGRITLIDGRRIGVTSTHKAINFAIQGDAAILMKVWTLTACDRLKHTSFRLLATVHDEIQAECLPEDVLVVREILEQTATETGQSLGFVVPIAATSKTGMSWAETH